MHRHHGSTGSGAFFRRFSKYLVSAGLFLVLAGCGSSQPVPRTVSQREDVVRDDLRTRIESDTSGRAMPRLLGLDEGVLTSPEMSGFRAEIIRALQTELVGLRDDGQYEQAISRWKSLAAVYAWQSDSEPAPEPEQPEIDPVDPPDTPRPEHAQGNEPIRSPEFEGRFSERGNELSGQHFQLDTLYVEWAQQLRRDGNLVASLQVLLRTPGLGALEPEILLPYLHDAIELNHGFAVERLADVLTRNGSEVPAEARAFLDNEYQLSDMLAGTATILVDQGIRIRGGVGIRDQVIGSGFFIDPRGYLITNYHVIRSQVDPRHDGFSRLFIRLPDNRSVRIPARVIGYDEILDIALLKAEVEPEYLFSVPDVQALRPGSVVFAMGSPGGLSSSISSGIISATGRRYLQLGDAMQIDAALNPGNSGGPVVHGDGTLVGVAFAGIAQFENVNFAVPSRWIQHILVDLYTEGQVRHGWLGLGLQPVRNALEVVYVLPGSSAAEAGVRPGDRIERIDGVPVRDLVSAQDLIMGLPVETLVSLEVTRDGQPHHTLVSLADRPVSPVEYALERDRETALFGALFGMNVQELSSSVWRRDFRVERVFPGTVADETGLSAQDPFSLQDWIVDTDNRVAILRIAIRPRRAGFITRGIQLAALLDPDNFI